MNYRLALIYAEQKEYVLAHPHALKVTALYPFNYEGQLLLAKIEITRGNILEAKNALMVCLQFNPKAKEALEPVYDLWPRLHLQQFLFKSRRFLCSMQRIGRKKERRYGQKGRTMHLGNRS